MSYEVILWVLFFLCSILSVPFFTVLERKVLSYIQLRKGPNKVSFLGILQPVSDGIKLLTKEYSFISVSNIFLFILFPCINMFLMILLWFIYPSFMVSSNLELFLLVFVCISAFNVYCVLGAGLSSNSKYSILGGLRGASQSISYEVILMILVLFPCICFVGYSSHLFLVFQNKIFLFFTFISFVFISVCETNRAPFDFAEGESELVSGFNTEYSSLGFAFLFISEYGSIIFISFLISFIALPGYFFLLGGLFFIFFFIWIRGSFPRFRYDLLMSFSWKVLLPFNILLLLVCLVLNLFINSS